MSSQMDGLKDTLRGRYMASWNEAVNKMVIAKPVSQSIKVGNNTVAVLYTDNVDTWVVTEITQNLEVYELLETLKMFAVERDKRITKVYFNHDYERFDIKVEDAPKAPMPR